MSTAAVSSSSLYQQIQSYFQTRKADLQQLGQALSSGDLADAQTAYNSLTALGQQGPFANGDAFRLSTREQDFNAIGQALQAGDLAGAQQAFSTLEATFQGGKQAVQAATVAASTEPEIVVNLSSNGASSAQTGTEATPVAASSGPEIVLNLSSGNTNPELTINIGAPVNGGAEQISFSLGNQQNSNQEQVTFNLSPNSNEQIVVNLLGATADSASNTTSATGSGINVSA
ncbi:MAG: hypothetical protein WB523_08540 [Candidatus Sulfotelmatobacter sp.]